MSSYVPHGPADSLQGHVEEPAEGTSTGSSSRSAGGQQPAQHLKRQGSAASRANSQLMDHALAESNALSNDPSWGLTRYGHAPPYVHVQIWVPSDVLEASSGSMHAHERPPSLTCSLQDSCKTWSCCKWALPHAFADRLELCWEIWLGFCL